MDKFICLIDHNNKIIDYSKNIIMDKSDYYELFDVVDCYVEEFKINYSQNPIISNPYKDYTKDTFPKDWTITCDYPKGSVADQIANKLNGGITYADSLCASGTSNY